MISVEDKREIKKWENQLEPYYRMVLMTRSSLHVLLGVIESTRRILSSEVAYTILYFRKIHLLEIWKINWRGLEEGCFRDTPMESQKHKWGAWAGAEGFREGGQDWWSLPKSLFTVTFSLEMCSHLGRVKVWVTKFDTFSRFISHIYYYFIYLYF